MSKLDRLKLVGGWLLKVIDKKKGMAAVVYFCALLKQSTTVKIELPQVSKVTVLVSHTEVKTIGWK